HAWIQKFSEHFEKVTVICLEKGDFDLPKNVSVFSLGKEHNSSRWFRLTEFYKISWKEKNNYDVVFVHMNQVYIVLMGIFWRMWRKKMALWYTHKSVNFSLRIAEKIVNIIFTASEESFRLNSKKKIVTGHGIDTDIFVPDYSKKKSNRLEVLSVGRISHTKGLDLCVRSLYRLKNLQVPFKFSIVGEPITKNDFRYLVDLQKLIKQKDLVKDTEFVGSISNLDSVKYFQAADVFVHPSDTGSLDKVILESMACGTPVVSSNDAAIPIVSKFNSNSAFKKGDEKDLTDKLYYFYKMKDNLHYLQEQIRQEVVGRHNLDKLIGRISEKLIV
ncbi:MAG: hypothetical protein COU27_00520, partial [Candidatus Levybacteria bacterium CG10_big_fil_rev_8_21_14_0_10_36_7]